MKSKYPTGKGSLNSDHLFQVLAYKIKQNPPFYLAENDVLYSIWVVYNPMIWAITFLF